MTWTWLLGLDFGIRDATAYVVLGWRAQSPVVYVAESWKESGKPPSEVAENVRELMKRYDFARIVGDLGGMGKAFAEEMRRRYSIPIEPAEKTNKLGFISLLNGALERGELLLVRPTNEELVKELTELPWADETHQKESDGFDNHLTDALLYAWRAASAYHEAPPPPGPTATEARAAMERQLWEAAEAEERARQERQWWES